MSRFTEAQYVLTGRLKNGRPEVRLTSDLVYHVGFIGSNWLIIAPAGFCSDLASVPAIPASLARLLVWSRPGRPMLRWLIRKRNAFAKLIARAAIVHDLMRQDPRWPKLVGDCVFAEAMGVDQVPAAYRLLAFAGVLTNFSRT